MGDTMIEMVKSDRFSQVYQTLNPAQKMAVDTIEGPVMVIAGPGTGKTQILAARIANILLKTDTNPSSVLALTFTESAAKNMRERLVQMIGRTGYYVQINTFHAFCSEVIQTHPEFFPIQRGSEPLTDVERYSLFETIITELPLSILKPINRPLFYLREIIKAISDLKREGFSPEQFVQIVDAEQHDIATDSKKKTATAKLRQEKNLQKQRELSEVFAVYDHRLRQLLRYDFDDMIALVVRAFQQEELLLREYQENVHYFLVDEYQDTNASQNKVVDLLGSFWSEQPNIFVVGDPNQAIYRFQGASIENVLGFVERYPQATVITLTEGYRCPQLINDAAAELISHNRLTELSGPLSAFAATESLHSTTGKGKPIEVYQAPSQTVELMYVADYIQALAAKGIPLDEIAVLYRHNRDAAGMQEVLDKWGVRYEIDGGDNILKDELIHQLLTLFRVIEQVRSGQEDIEAFEVMRYPWIDLNQTLVMKAARAAGKARLSLIELIEKGFDTFKKYDLGNSITPLEFEQLPQFLQQLQTWGAADGTMVFPAWFEVVIRDSKYLPWILAQPNQSELLIRLNSLFRQIKALAQSEKRLDLTSFLATIATMNNQGLQMTAEDLNITRDAVHLSTVHRAKGKEWRYVFLIHCLNGKWGNLSSRELLPLPAGLLRNTDLSKKEKNEDERRLFYVALTRAKQHVVITYPETIISEARSKEVVGSMFLVELREAAEGSYITTVTAPAVETSADEYLARMLQPTPIIAHQTDQTAFFNSLIADFKLSVTALNTYLRDPEEFVQNVLLRVPRAKPEPMVFGSAVHYALEKLFSQIQQTAEKPLLDLVTAAFTEALKRELITSVDFKRRLEYGIEILTKYHQQLDVSKVKPLFIERFFGGGWSKAYLDDIPLTGRIDRVDWLDQAKKEVAVIDYKTGSAKTAGFIEGKVISAGLSERELQLPENIRGPYKRQLLFYKLLTELDRSFVPTVTEGIFEFVEPDQKDRFISRRFTLTDADVEDLKILIKEVMTEIRQLKFLEVIAQSPSASS